MRQSTSAQGSIPRELQLPLTTPQAGFLTCALPKVAFPSGIFTAKSAEHAEINLYLFFLCGLRVLGGEPDSGITAFRISDSLPQSHKGTKFFIFNFLFLFVSCLPLQVVGRGCLRGS
jgi:hypothetical protein